MTKVLSIAALALMIAGSTVLAYGGQKKTDKNSDDSSKKSACGGEDKPYVLSAEQAA